VAKCGTWAASQEEADYLDRQVARNRAWVRSLEGKEKYLNRPQPNGAIGARARLLGLSVILNPGGQGGIPEPAAARRRHWCAPPQQQSVCDEPCWSAGLARRRWGCSVCASAHSAGACHEVASLL